ncbi:MAG: hypothetical protein PHX58_02455 [Desulfovibrio sp.]|nr:hypothetical protein [Desulfovibrio sp.]
MANKKLTREDLYELVWEKPTSQLAKDFNVSDSAIAKWCRKMEVPKPPRGYWAKKRSYAKVKKTPLKALTLKGVSSIQYNPAPPIYKKEEIHVEVPSDIKIVKGSLHSPHDLVKKAKTKFKKSKPDRVRGIIDLRRQDYLDIQVAPESLDRALLFFDSLLKTLLKMGARIGIERVWNKPKTVVRFMETAVEIGMYERAKRFKNEKAKSSDPLWLHDEYTYRPTGLFTFRVHSQTTYGSREWKDSAKQRVEDCLPAIIKEFYKFNEEKKQWDIRAKERKKQEVLERLEKERRLAEIAKEKRLLDAADQWDSFRKLEAFLEAIESAYPGNPKAREYVQWGRQVVERVDPIKKLKKQFDDDGDD